MKKILVVIVLSIALCASGSADAQLINPGFETGDFTGWTLSNGGLSSVVGAFTSPNLTNYDPVEGNWFALLETGGGTGVYTTASQTVFLDDDQTLSGFVAFAGGDYYPFNDDAYLTVNNQLLWSKDIATVGSNGASPWEPWSFTAPDDGLYTLEFGVRNMVDNLQPSFVLLDAAPAPIPEPATMILLCSGIAGLAGFRKKLLKRI